MMTPETAAERIWHAYEQGEGPPADLAGRLDLDSALRTQLAILERRRARGERLAGWKIGLTSATVRASFGTDEQPFGHLLASGVHPSPARVRLADVRGGCGIEPELCFVIGTRLAGPGATPARARAAAGAVCPGMEINERRIKGPRDFPLAVADNLTQWGIVVGPALRPVPAGFESDSLEVTMSRDGEEMAHVVGRDVIDDHFASLATLANVLGRYDLALEPGQHVITGSFSKHDVTGPGAWEATFAGVGSAHIEFE